MANIYNADFSNIKSSIINYFEDDETFNSYNFEGSATVVCIDIFSLIEESAIFYLNNTANEFFIQTAQQTKNIYKNAKKLNYHPIRKSAGYIETTFTSTVDMTVPIFEQFTMGSLTLSLLENVTLDSGNSHTATVTLYEGEILTETDIVNTTELFSFTLSETYSDIDNDHVYVYIDIPVLGVYPESTNLWINSDNEVIEVNSNSYFTSFTDTTYTIQFDNGRIFNVPSIDDRVRVKYLKTSGASANGSTGTITTTVSNLTVDPGSNVIENGTDEESLESIKLHAPLFYQSQRRGVTVRDWFAIFNRYSKASLFKDKNIWGGENENVDTSLSDDIVETPDTYRNIGKVIFTTLNSDYSFLSSTENSLLMNYLELYKIIGLRLRFLEPNIMTITPTINIAVSPSLSFSQSTFESNINAYLDDYETFNTSFYKAKLTKRVNEENAILYSFETFTTTITAKNESYKVIRIGSEIVAGSINGTVDSLTLDDDGSGNIRYNSVNVGTVNYTTGFIIISSALSTVDDYTFSFTLNSDEYINATRETILNFEDITVVSI
jgi:hypothetical protein